MSSVWFLLANNRFLTWPGRRAALIGSLIALLLLSAAPAAPQALASPGSCRELIVNGGFEAATLDPWIESSAAGFPLLDNFYVHSGEASVWLGGYINASDYLTQTVNLPAGAGVATLQFWTQISTLEPSGAAALDTLTVQIKNQAGQTLGVVTTLSNQDSSAGWILRSYDVAAYAGQTVYLVFHAANSPDVNSTDFHIDDVSLASCAQDLKVFVPWLRK